MKVVNCHKCVTEKIFLISGGLIILLALLQISDTSLYRCNNKDEVFENNAQVSGCFIKVSLQLTLGQKVEK